MTYYATFSLLLFFRVLDSGRGQSILYWFALIGLFVMSGFRFEVGCDWPNYLVNYVTQAGRGYGVALQQPNPAHWVLLETLHRLGLGYFWLNVVTSAIFFAGLHAVARRSPAPLAVLAMAFPVLILGMTMAAVKQAAAIGLICFAFNAFMDRKLLRMVGWVAAASTFHGSALVFLLLAPFVKGKYSKRNLLLSSVLAIPGVFVLLATDTAEVANSRYIESDIEAGGAIFRVGLLVATGVFYQLYLSKRWKAAFPESHKFISLMALGMIGLSALIPLSSVIADRFGYYFVIPQVFIYAALPWLYGRSRGVLVKVAPYVALGVLFVAWTFMSRHYQSCYLPYALI
jgi:hypothetical protein